MSTPNENTEDLPKTYEAKSIESKWLEFWENHHLFKVDPLSKKPPYTICLPPPNVTGALHMGHALGITLQDILIRWKRMLGFEALYIPGTDHAGIATQTTVERHLIKTQGKTRKDFSREEFLKYVWEWKVQNEDRITKQLKKMGASSDFSNMRFTMDDTCSKAVKTIFKRLYDQGLIYQGDYLVNWDPVTQTALADDEVEYEDKESYLWHFKYPLSDGTGFAKVATTRPETMLGDTAVAVSPKDPRYKSWVGKTVILPLMEREIPIIADRRVDPEFGTGMVKVTPAHDPNDYETGLEHKLPFINIMTPDGRINENGGSFQGLTMLEARDAVVKEMEKKGFLEKIEPHNLRVGVSYRSKAIIEPYLSKQWFVKMESFGKKLKSLVESGKFQIIPDNWENTYFHWIDNLRDWCISRQLWWGHRIPVWYHKDNPEIRICYDGEGLPEEVRKDPDNWKQDEDVLDTWFSSALWPFSTLGWPEKTDLLKKFYPNQVLVTGHDILFFWVARMLVMGEFVFDKEPFPETFLHGLIYGKSYWRKNKDGGILYVTPEERIQYDLGKPLPKDVESKWEKMSKTKGNVIDPLEISDQYGVDALRMALASSQPQQREIDLDRRRFEEFKNFANKVWNGARFVFINIESLSLDEFQKGLDEKFLSLEDHWIISSLAKTVYEVNDSLKNYAFDKAATLAYDFYWQEFCSYYVEIVKPVLFGKAGTDGERANKKKLLVIILLQSIRLLHPMIPFITEELFQRIKTLFGNAKSESSDPYTKDAIRALSSLSISQAPYPEVLRETDLDLEINSMFDLIGKVVYTIRNLRGEMKIPPQMATEVMISGPKEDPIIAIIKKHEKIITALVRVSKIEVKNESEIPLSSSALVDSVKISLPIPKEMINEEIQRLIKEENRLKFHLERVSKQLSNENYIAKAPPSIVSQQKENLLQTESELKDLEAKLISFKKLIDSGSR
ncbi:valine--tRNA ligase [Criblamydia sequanensis]|uniref:Valine--tRNA ligase n=1 Tax=Candidatus Criblamydia sequanensis CRIB-18 TaxID=1437425 RepID=A0A090CYT7_9BACT|nr:valine--tRNA ligase [Criblamydia sequanensis]CDR33882.1 Valyl-tRNA synthetase [Criblamydia sequanensis CRIB-18]